MIVIRNVFQLNMPDPISGNGARAFGRRFRLPETRFNSALLKNALLRTIAAAQIAGIRAVLLRAVG